MAREGHSTSEILFHPCSMRTPGFSIEPAEPPTAARPTGTWAERAAALGRDLGPETTWWTLLGTAPYEGGMGHGPEEGRLNESEVATLASFLGAHTADRQRHAGSRSGRASASLDGGAALLRSRGSLLTEWRELRRARADDRPPTSGTLPTSDVRAPRPKRPILSALPRIGHRRSEFRFGEGGWFQSPTLWWPDDKSWFVHTEIDASSTLPRRHPRDDRSARRRADPGVLRGKGARASPPFSESDLLDRLKRGGYPVGDRRKPI